MQIYIQLAVSQKKQTVFVVSVKKRRKNGGWSWCPPFISLSALAIFFTALRMAGQFVSIPPGQRSITYGILGIWL